MWPITLYILYLAYFRVQATTMTKRAIYDPASMEATIQELQINPELSLVAVAKKYGIHRTSLQFK